MALVPCSGQAVQRRDQQRHHEAIQVSQRVRRTWHGNLDFAQPCQGLASGRVVLSRIHEKRQKMADTEPNHGAPCHQSSAPEWDGSNNSRCRHGHLMRWGKAG
ncbi:MAG: hypothetical protein FWC28_05990 [Proteobacteria bacterium]|nr:hypothetical protein [Cystobacterineae bacterium]MCL2258835.1 hypothetical protein [Cystobacterineae bacterium]MCL2314783.1 hypothetical protein [Pseudomonadota bacterium]